ncbi:uncharacterized protein V1518DRAFT_419649 [Limtongia smithiae]|uniref:uncharacterized protein n=1 Tax=Limtongia smithiae TaxID=1125753 RepID=UPI0034CD783B
MSSTAASKRQNGSARTKRGFASTHTDETCPSASTPSCDESQSQDGNNSLPPQSKKQYSSMLVPADVLNTGALNRGLLLRQSGDHSEDDSGFEIPKKRMRKEKRRSRMFPSFDVVTTGNSNNQKERISVGDLRDLVLWVLADGVAPRWLSIFNKTGISHVVALMIPGLTPDMFGLTESSTLVTPVTAELPIRSELSFFRDTFRFVWPTRSPGDRTRVYSSQTAFLNSPLPKLDKKQQKEDAAAAAAAHKSQKESTVMPLEDLFMSASDFEAAEYPQNEVDADSGWVTTREGTSCNKDTKLVQDKYVVYGLDCEMVMTTHGSELARMTVVDWESNIVLDELVQPQHAITDYLTQYSGISGSLLKDVHTSLADAQRKILEIVGAQDVLVGHSLENDFRALQLHHGRVVDTAVIYDHPRGPPAKPSLKWLAQKFLSREIQKQTVVGHDSAEDARTCVDLLRLKLQMGPTFGILIPSTEPLLRRLVRVAAAERGGGAGMESATRTGAGAVVDYGNPGQWHGADARTIIACKSDDDVVHGVRNSVTHHDLVWARFRELEYTRGWNVRARNGSPTATTRAGSADDSTAAISFSDENDITHKKDNATNHEDVEQKLSAALTAVNTRVTELWNSLPPTTALIIFSGGGDPREFVRLNAAHSHFLMEYRTKKWDEIAAPWTDTENEALAAAARVARGGVSFLGIKPSATAT